MALPLQLAGGVFSAVSAKKQGDMAMENAKRDAKIIENRNKSEALTTLENMRRAREEKGHEFSAMKANIGRGLLTTEGSSRDFLREAEERLELRILDESKAQNDRDRGSRNQAAARLDQGRQAQHQGKMKAFGALLGTGVKVARLQHQFANETPGGGGGSYLQRSLWF